LRCKTRTVSAVCWHVRKLLAVGLIVLPLGGVCAQNQERKLEDRIMQPDMTLENSAQNKQFTADKTSVKKKARVSTFYLEKKPQQKDYAGTRAFRSGEFNAENYKQNDQPVADELAGKKARQSTYVDSAKGAKTKQAYDQDKTRKSREYPGSREYREQGKSQKSLNRKNRPMTIDEVRDLLNKNK